MTSIVGGEILSSHPMLGRFWFPAPQNERTCSFVFIYGLLHRKSTNILTRVFLTHTILSLGRSTFIGPEGKVGLFYFLLHHREQDDG